MDAITTEQAAAPLPLRYGFRFEGSGGEFFKIWIVNLALTVVTLVTHPSRPSNDSCSDEVTILKIKGGVNVRYT